MAGERTVCVDVRVKKVTHIGRQGHPLYHIYPVTTIETDVSEVPILELMGNLDVEEGDILRVCGYPKPVLLTSKNDAELVENRTKGWTYQARVKVSEKVRNAMQGN